MENTKLFTISEASEIVGVEPSTLRYWEKIFKTFLRPRKTSGKQRRYNYDDLNILIIIKYLLKVEKYTLDGAKRKLKHFQKKIGNSPQKFYENFTRLFAQSQFSME